MADLEQVRAFCDGEPALSHLGLRVDAVDGTSVTASMPVTTAMVNELGVVHGGYAFLLADSCFALVNYAARHPSLTRHAEITFVGPAAPGLLHATGRLHSIHGRSCIVDVSVTGDDGSRVAELRVHGTAPR